MRRFFLAAPLALLAPWACAQRMSSAPAHLAASHQSSAPATSRTRISSVRPDFASLRSFRHSSPYQTPFSSFGIFSDFPYPDSSYPDNGPPPSDSTAAEPALLLQALSALTANQQASAIQQRTGADAHSLLIELQGNSYVSLTNAQPSANGTPEPEIVAHASKGSSRNDLRQGPAATRELAPVTLLFRDGHREDVRDYTIADGVIYARGDFYNDGYWNKKIELSALDLRETVRSNQDRGIQFVIPNAPNEVITRP